MPYHKRLWVDKRLKEENAYKKARAKHRRREEFKNTHKKGEKNKISIE